MRRMHRIVLLVGLVALAPVLAGCEDFDMDKLDVFGLNEKKKLPGDRKPVFPQGVPGVTQGHSAGIHEGQPAAAGHRATPPAAGATAADAPTANRPRRSREDRRGRAGGRAQAESRSRSASRRRPRAGHSRRRAASGPSQSRASSSQRPGRLRRSAAAARRGRRHAALAVPRRRPAPALRGLTRACQLANTSSNSSHGSPGSRPGNDRTP